MCCKPLCWAAICHKLYFGVTSVMVQLRWVHTVCGLEMSGRRNRDMKETQRHRIVLGGATQGILNFPVFYFHAPF